MSRNLQTPPVQLAIRRRSSDSIVPPSKTPGRIQGIRAVGASPFARAIASFKNLVLPEGAMGSPFHTPPNLIRRIINQVSERGPHAVNAAHTSYLEALRAVDWITTYKRREGNSLAGHTRIGTHNGEIVVQRCNELLDLAADPLAAKAVTTNTVIFHTTNTLFSISPSNPQEIRKENFSPGAEKSRILLPLGENYGLIEVRGDDLRFKGWFSTIFSGVWSARDISKLFSMRIAADTDPLTGLPTRRAFTEHRQYCEDRFTTSRIPASVLMIDIDNFKRINDRHGHVAGDQVLSAVAAICAMSLRTSDVVAQGHKRIVTKGEVSRYGGEEFAAMLPNADTEGAIVAAQRCRKAVEAHPIMLSSGKKVHVTVTIGVASFLDAERAADGKEKQSLGERVLLLADKALYAGKNSGWNQVVAPAFGLGNKSNLPIFKSVE